MKRYLVQVKTTVDRYYQGEVKAYSRDEAVKEARESYIDWNWDDLNEKASDVQILDEEE